MGHSEFTCLTPTKYLLLEIWKFGAKCNRFIYLGYVLLRHSPSSNVCSQLGVISSVLVQASVALGVVQELP
jgi:hypothetical protein